MRAPIYIMVLRFGREMRKPGGFGGIAMQAAGQAFGGSELGPIDLAPRDDGSFRRSLFEGLAELITQSEAFVVGDLVVGQVPELAGGSW